MTSDDIGVVLMLALLMAVAWVAMEIILRVRRRKP